MAILRNIIRTGTQNVDDIAKHAIIAVNRFSLVSLILTSCFGIVFYILTGELQILAAGLTEATLLAGVLWLNSRHKHLWASYAYICIINASLVYFSGILAAIIEVHLAFLLMFGASLLFFRKDKHRMISIGITALTLLICEYNYSYPFINPILKTDYEQMLLRWLARPGIILLDSLVLWYYKKTNEALYNDLMKRSKELEAANTSKNFFIRVTNHELKGPLNAIHEISQTLLLNDEVDESPSLKPLAEDLYTASTTAMQEVTNVLDMSQIEAGKINQIDNSPINIRQFLMNLCKVHQYTANRKKVSIVTEFHDQLPLTIISDKAKLTKVMSNLLVNAVKFTAPKSRVTVKAYVKDGLLYMAVKDRGKGIERERLHTIFDPFETEQNNLMEGSGLGLFITRHFIELLGGKITVNSSPNEGTVFTLHMPLTTGQAAPQDVQPAIAAAEYSGKKVLICEDDEISRVYLAKFLERTGCTTLLADNGANAINLAQQEMPDLLILDSHMPVMSGKETITHIRKHPQLAHLPIIVISGDAYSGESEELLTAGASEYLLKPVSFRTLSDVMRKYLTSPVNNKRLPPAQAIR